MEKMIEMEKRLAAIETQLTGMAKASADAQAQIEPIMSGLLAKMGISAEGSMQAKVMAMIETMTHKVSAPR